MPISLPDFAASVPGFTALTPAVLVRYFAFYIHEHEGREAFGVADLQSCFDALHLVRPTNLWSLLSAMGRGASPSVLKVRGGYKLEGRVRGALRARLPAIRPQAVLVEKALTDLPAKLPDFAERQYLEEALICYRGGAFRAAIVMTWNLAYDRLCNWIIRNKLADFNAQIPLSFNKKPPIASIQSRDDFAELKESQVLQICRSAGITSVSLDKHLKERLNGRNSYAHPSSLKVTQLTAEAYIESLVTNVVAHFN